MSKKKLFAIYLGGKADRCNIELHDVVFAVGSTIEETYPLLVKKWFGNPNQFHVDAYLDLTYIDGYEIQLSKAKAEEESKKKLYFINLGAYKAYEFTEYHQCGFYIAASAPEAIKRAKEELCLGLQTVHKDDLILLDRVSNSLEYDVDDILEVKEVDDYYISLSPSHDHEKIQPICGYIKLDNFVCK